MQRDPHSTLARLVLSTACLLAAACASSGGGNPEAAPAAVSPVANESEPAASPAAVAPPAPDPSPAPEASTETTFSNRVKWKTASELNNFGYDVYRGESPEGPFESINPEVIEGAGTTDEPTAYEYFDRTIDPHKTYYYYVESISMNGVRSRFTPIGKAKAKIATGDDQAARGPGGGTDSDN